MKQNWDGERKIKRNVTSKQFDENLQYLDAQTKTFDERTLVW